MDKKKSIFKNDKVYLVSDIIMNVLVVTMFSLVTIAISTEFRLSLLIIDILFVGLVYFVINLINNNNARQITKIILYGALLFCAYADITSYSWYSQVFKFYEASNFPILLRSFKIGFRFSLTDILSVLAVILVISVFAIIQMKNKEIHYKLNTKKISNKAMLCLATIPFLFTLSTIFVVSTYDHDYYYSDTFLVKEVYSNEEYIVKYGYAQYRIRKLLPKIQVEDNYMEEAEEYFNRNYTKNTNEFTNAYEDYNVITIQVETLDTRLVNEYTMPNLYGLMNDSIVVNDYFVPEYQQGATCNSEYMAMTSLYPYTGNDITNIMCRVIQDLEITNSLPRQLSSLGYTTHYYHNGTNQFYYRDKVIPNSYGFDVSGFTKSGAAASVGTEEANEVVDSAMLDFADDIDFDNLFYINYLTYTMHVGAIDYTQEEYEYIQENLGPVEDEFLIDYYAEQMGTDQFIGELIELLKEKNVYDNTLIYVYSDHYPYGTDGTVHDYLDLLEIEYTNTNEVHRQSLVIHDGGKTVEEYTIPSSTIDIAPTILNMVSDNTTVDYRYYFGNDIFDELSLVSFSNYDIYYEGEFFGFRTDFISDYVTDIHFNNYTLRRINDFAIRTRNENIIRIR